MVMISSLQYFGSLAVYKFQYLANWLQGPGRNTITKSPCVIIVANHLRGKTSICWYTVGALIRAWWLWKQPFEGQWLIAHLVMSQEWGPRPSCDTEALRSCSTWRIHPPWQTAASQGSLQQQASCAQLAGGGLWAGRCGSPASPSGHKSCAGASLHCAGLTWVWWLWPGSSCWLAFWGRLNSDAVGSPVDKWCWIAPCSKFICTHCWYNLLIVTLRQLSPSESSVNVLTHKWCYWQKRFSHLCKWKTE